MRNIRAIGGHDGRGLVQFASTSNPKTVRVRAPTAYWSHPQSLRIQPVTLNYLCPGRIRAGFTSGSA